LGFGYDYDVVNTDAILNKMQVRNGRIYLPHGQYYEVLVLPNGIKINVDVLKKLEQLAAAGATIIGSKPSLSYGLNNSQQNDKQVQAIAGRLWGSCDSVNIKENNYGKGKIVWGKSIRDVLLQKKVLPDVQVNSDAIDFIHRKIKDAEIYFIRNTKKETVTQLISFRVDHLQPELWNAETGEITTIPFYYAAKNEVTLPLTLPVNGSCFIVFRSVAGNKQLDKKNFLSLPSNADVNIWYSKKAAITTTNGEWKLGATHQTVQLPEPVSLNNPWILHFDQQNAGIGRDTMKQLISLNQSTNDAIKYYSGNVIYTTNFTISKDRLKSNQRLILDLGWVKEIAEVIVNGKNTGFCWHEPFQIDITDATKAGENFLQVEVVNTINNRLIGDAKLPEQYRRMKSNITKLPNAWRTPFAEAPLLDAGLIGPVQIRFAQILGN